MHKKAKRIRVASLKTAIAHLYNSYKAATLVVTLVFQKFEYMPDRSLFDWNASKFLHDIYV